MPTDIDALVDRLRVAQSERLDPLDLPRAWTLRQVRAYVNQTPRFATFISGLRDAPDQVERFARMLEPLEAERATVVAKGAELAATLAAEPDWRGFPNAHDRDRQYERLAMLRRQIELLPEGGLYRPDAPGVCYRPLAWLDHQITTLTKRRDDAQSQLDALVAQAEALLAETRETVSTT